MHGLIFLEFKHYIQTKLDPNAWDDILKEAGLTGKIYSSLKSYSDQEIMTLMSIASEKMKFPFQELLEDFGLFIAPFLYRTSQHSISSSWDYFTLLENTQGIIHCMIARSLPGSIPPFLKCTRVSPDEVTIHYNSPRRMCSFAVGLLKGLADVYKIPVSIQQPVCMNKGGSFCEIHVKKLA